MDGLILSWCISTGFRATFWIFIIHFLRNAIQNLIRATWEHVTNLLSPNHWLWTGGTRLPRQSLEQFNYDHRIVCLCVSLHPCTCLFMWLRWNEQIACVMNYLEMKCTGNIWGPINKESGCTFVARNDTWRRRPATLLMRFIHIHIRMAWNTTSPCTKAKSERLPHCVDIRK